jgi:transposase-like protein
MARQKKQSTESAVREIRRRTRRKFSPEEKIRIVLEGLRGEQSISDLCRREGIAAMLRTVFTSRFSDKRATFTFAGETREELSTLCEMIEAGKIQSIVDRVLPMDQAAAAHRLVETEERRGAIVLEIGD